MSKKPKRKKQRVEPDWEYIEESDLYEIFTQVVFKDTEYIRTDYFAQLFKKEKEDLFNLVVNKNKKVYWSQNLYWCTCNKKTFNIRYDIFDSYLKEKIDNNSRYWIIKSTQFIYKIGERYEHKRIETF